MGHPGRPRRRNKMMPSHQQPLVAQPRQPVKEEPMVQLHDEADLISFRSDALHRFVTNQEYLENVTSKHIQSSKIIPPSSFPSVPKRENVDGEELKKIAQNLKPEEVYFGDLKLMKIKKKLLGEEIDKLKHEKSPYSIDRDREYTYRRENIDKLASLQSRLGTSESFEALETELNNVLEKYESEFNKKYTSISSVHKHSQPINDLTHQTVHVTHAPENYNPRLINSFVSINNNEENNDQSHDNLFGDEVNFNGNRNEMPFIDSFEQPHQSNEFNSNGEPAISNDFTISMVANNNQNMNNDDSNNTHNNNENNNNDDIDQLFNEGNDDPVMGNTNDQEMDNMDELIDFQQADDEMMGGTDFDQYFLSQIDHSME